MRRGNYPRGGRGSTMKSEFVRFRNDLDCLVPTSVNVSVRRALLIALLSLVVVQIWPSLLCRYRRDSTKGNLGSSL